MQLNAELEGLGVRVQPRWLEAVQAQLGPPPLKAVLQQFLAADLNTVGAPCLPQNVQASCRLPSGASFGPCAPCADSGPHAASMGRSAPHPVVPPSRRRSPRQPQPGADRRPPFDRAPAGDAQRHAAWPPRPASG